MKWREFELGDGSVLPKSFHSAQRWLWLVGPRGYGRPLFGVDPFLQVFGWRTVLPRDEPMPTHRMRVDPLRCN